MRKEVPTSSTRPLMLYDGHCSFCRKSVDRMQRWVGTEIRFTPLQSAEDCGVAIPPEELAASIHLVDKDGSVRKGAEAIFYAGALYGRGFWTKPPWFAYRFIPGFATVAEAVYGWIARNRTCTIADPEEETGSH